MNIGNIENKQKYLLSKTIDYFSFLKKKKNRFERKFFLLHNDLRCHARFWKNYSMVKTKFFKNKFLLISKLKCYNRGIKCDNRGNKYENLRFMHGQLI